MRFDQLIVSQTPLHRLWNDLGVVSEVDLRVLNAADIAGLLREGKVRFVVAEAGSPLKWIPVDECYSFWKSEVKNHLADSVTPIYLGDFPNQYCYFASEWEAGSSEPIVFLLKSH